MKQSHGFTRLLPTIITMGGMIVSFGLLAWAMRLLPLGTAYAVWTGIGTVGAFVTGVALYGEVITTTRIIAALLILAGLALMKFSSRG
jgi:quaternary ammonium compound-resistance protein SugE